MEVKGPGARTHHEIVSVRGALQYRGVGLLGREFALGGPDGYAELNGFEEIDVTPEGLVVIRCFILEIANGPGDDAGKLGVLAGQPKASTCEQRTNLPC